ncbi:malto-oligosyltrehalose synthase [Novosphingobium sp. YJ-S2-02]|uniref:Malto-oligosyltrehalose synthase n=1 Tax=Novosphingobium aureum TaxID=2792964 RepID=A0A931HBU4_9SPHN|nr:malto-oligosyltrehalose synthase [Novosphingobium aureum]MBH0112581.1 malto-oligosyltrehalose synthase [Novosphingobium aureum]
MIAWVATYRLQLRGGVDLDAARGRLEAIKALGASHLYLSPPFTAAPGSSHGYDVTDPTRIDPVLGGEDAFARLAEAARAAGMGLVIDIVPNHMAFTPESPWLADVLRFGRESEFAHVFDIDWERGPIHFPALDGTVQSVFAQGHIAMAGTGENPQLAVYERRFPLALTPLARALASGVSALDGESLDALMAQQHWSLGDWRESAQAIVHRRFFNITDLIGVRQEDEAVFARSHALVIELVRSGQVQGVRVDHVDGLALPGEYLARLRAALDAAGGSAVPIWAEKIVKQGEDLVPSWPIEGMTGYELAAEVTRLLTCRDGLAAMREAAAGAEPEDYAQEVLKVRAMLLDEVFVPEMERVAQAARRALGKDGHEARGLREAIAALARHWPVYRSYSADGESPEPWLEVALDGAADEDVPGPALAAVADLVRKPKDAEAKAFVQRFEQLTGALTAKSEEDTVFFRKVSYLPLCEVGAEPELTPIGTARFAKAMEARAALTPMALNALSTHDTKRSADARAALIALSYRGAFAGRLYAAAREAARKRGLPEACGLYAVQLATMMEGQDDAAARITDHVAKALREGKVLSSHEAPDARMEQRVAKLALDILGGMASPVQCNESEEARHAALFHDCVLVQAALQILCPGIPDIYQGTEMLSVTLTDPDNRRTYPLEVPADGLSARKYGLVRDLLALRASDPELFTHGTFAMEEGKGRWQIERRLAGRLCRVSFPAPGAAKGAAMWALAVETRDAP